MNASPKRKRRPGQGAANLESSNSNRFECSIDGTDAQFRATAALLARRHLIRPPIARIILAELWGCRS
jgi:hypothetical protein